MASRMKRLGYFEKWIDPVAVEMLLQRNDVELSRLQYDSPVDDNWSQLERMHGYQASAGGDMRGSWRADATLLARCPNLLAVSSTGAGFDVIDVDACTKAGVIVCNQAGSNKEAVAEHALGLILSLSKLIALMDRMLRRRSDVDRYGNIGRDIRGRTLGIVGIGHAGGRLAELCRAFDMKILACDPYLSASEVGSRGGIKVDLADLLRQSDFVSVHCPRNGETTGMFGAAQFALMKPTAYFICTARGGIVKEDELATALSAKTIAGAGIDVFLKEPPPHDHPLLAFDNVIATPHIAGMTAEALHEMAASAARQWMQVFDGNVPPHVVNPEAWPRYSDKFERLLGFRPQAHPRQM